MIEVQQLSKDYGGFKAVDNISFSVGAGEIVGFLGPNGAGKTTTIRILTCYHPASSGSARVAGHDVFSESTQVREKVGYLPESVPLYTEMRVREYLHFRGKLRGMDRAQRNQAIGRVAEQCWIRDVIARPIGQLSKGYRQRVGLADALLHNPPVLILDEPTVGLDPAQIRETRAMIRQLAPAHTVMLSSHILPEVEATCARLVMIHRGRIVAAGAIDELRSRLSGQSRLIAEIRGALADVQSGLRALPGVSDVHCTARDGWVRASVSGAAGADQRLAVYQLCVARQWELRELRPEIASLEEFFVKMVTTSGPAPDGGAADAMHSG